MKILRKINYFWLIIAFLCALSVFIAHVIFQHWLYMMPCERCVYIRYGFFVAFFGAILALILPKKAKIIAYLLTLYGVGYGIFVSYELIKIKNSIISGDIFGMAGCKMLPSFHFNLPLHEWWSDMFEPKALCGFDEPQVPFDANLSALQGYLTQLYSSGWYLVPQYEFLNLAHCAIIIFTLILVLCFLAIFKDMIWKLKSF